MAPSPKRKSLSQKRSKSTAIRSFPPKARASKPRKRSGGPAEIARLRAALQEKELLLKEIHHRIKNNIQIIASLLRLQASQLADDKVKAALLVCQSRIRSISLIHEKLYQSPDLVTIDFGDYIRTLSGELLRLFGTEASSVQLDVRAQGIRLPTKKAISCGLIISELVANALKYAFPEERKGTIRIEMSSQAQGRTALVVSDDGVGLPADFEDRKARRLGFQIVSDLV
jgi:two-component sensor histidine kinase